MNRAKPMLLTVFFAFVILGAGYFGIRESGGRILKSGSTLEELDYENTSSNIFYGKIEEDIELFPWNYYPQQGGEKGVPSLFLEERMSVLPEGMGPDDGKEAAYAADWYFVQMIAYECGADAKEVWEHYEGRPGGGIIQNMQMAETRADGCLYFFQDVLELDGKKYQVRIACSEWGILNFTCAEYSHGKKGSREGWEEGKEKLADIVERSDGGLEECFAYLLGLQEIGLDVGWEKGEYAMISFERMPFCYELYRNDEKKCVNACLQGLAWLDGMLGNGGRAAQGQEGAESQSVLPDEGAGAAYAENGAAGTTPEESGMEDAARPILEYEGNQEAIRSIEAYGMRREAEQIMEEEAFGISESGQDLEDGPGLSEEMPENSYQIVELSDMILLLMQGETMTIGVYYDPMSQRFCGYHYFYE